MRTKLLIEQHFHGAFGVNFNTATVDDILFLSKEILKYGIGGIFPTLVTDSVENINRAVAVIKEAASNYISDVNNGTFPSEDEVFHLDEASCNELRFLREAGKSELSCNK